MMCPRCRTSDIYVSQNSNVHWLLFLWVNLRCHRCCNLFSVPRWKAVGLDVKSAAKERKPA